MMAELNSSRGQGRRVEEFYDIQGRLTVDAVGAGGEVRRGLRRADGEPFAIKVCVSPCTTVMSSSFLGCARLPGVSRADPVPRGHVPERNCCAACRAPTSGTAIRVAAERCPLGAHGYR
jgi:hypothetical protein